MTKSIWVKTKPKYGKRKPKKYCVITTIATCFNATFLHMPPDDPDEDLDALTDRVNAVIEDFIGAHPDQELRILAGTEEGDLEDQLRFAFVETDLELELPNL